MDDESSGGGGGKNAAGHGDDDSSSAEPGDLICVNKKCHPPPSHPPRPPPDPCLLCGEPAVHYDAEGNVIKRECRLPLLHDEDDNGYSAFFPCIFKCFGVGRNGDRRFQWNSSSGGGGNYPLPVCGPCEGLVAMLLEVYDKVEELEGKLKKKAEEAEGKFLEEDLYNKNKVDDDDDDDVYRSFRRMLFGGRGGRRDKDFRGSNLTSQQTETDCEPQQQQPPAKCDIGSEAIITSFPERTGGDSTSPNTTSVGEIEEIRSGMSLRKRKSSSQELTISDYVESFSEGDDADHNFDVNSEEDATKSDIIEEENDSDRDPDGSSSGLPKKSRTSIKTVRRKRRRGRRRNVEAEEKRVIKPEESIIRGRGRGRPTKLTRRSGRCPVCEMPVASQTNSAYYDHRLSHLSKSERRHALANPVVVNVNVKKTTKGDGGSGSGGGHYYSYSHPRLPRVAKKRKITSESASLYSDVNQCPTCGKFVSSGQWGLRQHERTHLSSEVEAKKSPKMHSNHHRHSSSTPSSLISREEKKEILLEQDSAHYYGSNDDDDDEEVAPVSFPGGTSDKSSSPRRTSSEGGIDTNNYRGGGMSLRTRKSHNNISYAEAPSSEGDASNDDTDYNLDAISSEPMIMSPDLTEDVKPEIEDNAKDQRPATINKSRATRTRKVAKPKEEVKLQRRRRPGRPPKPKLTTRPTTTMQHKTCKVDPITGAISYTHFAKREDNSRIEIILEFAKHQSSSSTSPATYQCSKCSNTISFSSGDAGGDSSIDPMILYRHARDFHRVGLGGPPTRKSGRCPVCGMPVACQTNSDYYDHRLSHLSEEERAEALRNPVVVKQGRISKKKGHHHYSYSHPRLPRVEHRRKISFESASFYDDVNQCPTCGKFVSNGAWGLRQHERGHLPEAEKRVHLCASCGGSFTTKRNLELHHVEHHNGVANRLKCGICKRHRVFTTEKAFREHMQKNHQDSGPTALETTTPPRPFPCPQCDKSFGTEHARNGHITRSHVNLLANLGTHTCSGCKLKFGSKEERLEHIKEVHPKSKIALLHQNTLLDPDQPARCNYPNCRKGFPDESSLRSHISQEHPQGPVNKGCLMCPHCGKNLAHSSSLKLHLLLHSGEKKHGCPRCKASFRLASTLKGHLAAVHGEGPLSGHFQCERPGCDDNKKVFQSRVLYGEHLRLVHKIFVRKGQEEERNLKQVGIGSLNY